MPDDEAMAGAGKEQPPDPPDLNARRELGRAARQAAPRSSHGAFAPAAGRPDPVALLEHQAATRVPVLVPIRHGRMLQSPFAFFRGAALLMAGDLAATPTSGLSVQCCGDAHLSNFGVFGSPERRLVFDINDFDETHPGPWEWDVKRLGASVLIAAQSNGFDRQQQDAAVLATVEAYRATMRSFAAMSNLEVWYARVDVDETLARMRTRIRARALRSTERNLAKARRRNSASAFAKLAYVADGQARIRPQPPLVVPIEALAADRTRQEVFDFLRSIVASYTSSLPYERRLLLAQYVLADFAHKIVGVGSVGMQAWIALLIGHDDRDPLFLQVKEAGPSVLEQFLQPSQFDNHGQRVVTGQRLMQASSDIFLGWLRAGSVEGQPPRDFYVRQLKDWKGSAEVEELGPPELISYGRLCGWTLARAHARSGDRVAIASYLGKGPTFDRAITRFARRYAAQNQLDYQVFAQAVADGRIAAQTGV